MLVPQGTVVREAIKGKLGKGEVLMELVRPGQKALLLPGGRGGRGNASFKSGNNKIPKIAERGEEGAEMYMLFLIYFLLVISLNDYSIVDSNI